MKHIHILGAGGAAGIGLSRCLRDHFHITGWDDNHWAQKLAECSIENVTEADLILPTPDSLVARYCELPNTWLPPKRVVEVCQDKAVCAKWLGDICAPVHWVRDTTGAGGAGAHLQMAQDYLPGRNLSCELVFKDGELLGYFQKHRLSYEVKCVQPFVQGIGQSAVSRCIDEKTVLDVSVLAVRRIAGDEAEGIFGVDLREDIYGAPLVTEINPGRFLTASYCFYYTVPDYNLPRLAAEAALGLPITPLGDYPEGIGIIRQIDRAPWVGRLHDGRTDHATL